MIQIETIEQLESFLSNNPHSMLFKHSTACPVSSKSFKEFKDFIETNPVPSAVIHVIESQVLSNYVAELTRVAHQSPQLLMFCKDKCCDSLSHYLITADRIKGIVGREC